MDKLVESFLKLRAEAKECMSEEEFRKAERQFDELVRKVRARRRHGIRS
jgi:flagellar biosynthesis chaperone FliJ